jgi:hypothetical protein
MSVSPHRVVVEYTGNSQEVDGVKRVLGPYDQSEAESVQRRLRYDAITFEHVQIFELEDFGR